MKRFTKKLLWQGNKIGAVCVVFKAENIVHYKVDCDASSVKKSAQLQDEREVKLNGINGSESVFYKTVSLILLLLVLEFL